jgi:hypothetical protein
LLDIGTGATADAPADWVNEDDVAASYLGTRYVVAVPSTRQVIRFDESGTSLTPTLVTSLPELTGTITASAFGDLQRIVSTAFDTSGLYGALRVTASSTKSVMVDGPREVLAAQGRYALVGKPSALESPPSLDLELWDLEALP